MNQEPDETSPLPESNDDGQPEASESSEMTDTRNPQAEADGEGSLAPKEQEAEENNGEEKENGRGLNFIDHLDEIRGRIIHSAIALILMVALSAIFADFLVEVVIIGPLKRSSDTLVLQNLVPYGQISLYLQAVFFTGFILSFPYMAWQIWQFVAPGLHEHERQAGRFSILFISLSFFTGIAFGYFVFLPVSLQFFAAFGSTLIENNISIQDYTSFFIGALLTAGMVFELPFISYILSKIGLLTPAFMRFYRKHAIVFLLIVAAVVTPSTDLVTQLVIGIPMILLYEASILISAHVNRKNEALK
ncbi:MAG: twin-arginine translocase subunit TatC [Candidatus Chlorobium antarcticum]|jgi:sec-independent protein translocase protein TatC|nr:twin-arginine translocase subunit TatC [Candidatus Chlorobium antarcticum]